MLRSMLETGLLGDGALVSRMINAHGQVSALAGILWTWLPNLSNLQGDP
jgi:hypothetical protein